MEMFVYKCLQLVIGEITSRNSIYISYWLPLVNQTDQVQICIKSNIRTYEIHTIYVPRWLSFTYCSELRPEGVEQSQFFLRVVLFTGYEVGEIS